MTIYQSIFTYKPLHVGAYELMVQFLNGEGCSVSDRSFVFESQSVHQVEGEVLDVYSQNGICKSPILKTLFKKQDCFDVANVAKRLAPLGQSLGPLVYVLDLKGAHSSYLDPTISKCEDVVCQFFKKSSVEDEVLPKYAKQIHELFQSTHPLDFVLCEGSLKKRLIHEFSDFEADFFLSKRGSQFFCEFTEPFINGFKVGQQVRGIEAHDYMTPVSNKYTAFQPHRKSTVWYPPFYKDLYSLEGAYAKRMSSAFSVSGDYDQETEITTMSLRVKS